MVEIAEANGVTFPACPINGRRQFGEFTDFLLHNTQVRDCLRQPIDFRRIAYEYCEDEANQGTRYAELYFTAALHGHRVGDPAMPLLAVLEGLDEGQATFGITVRLLLDHSRRRSVRLAATTVELAARYMSEGVVGVGLSSDDCLPLAPFAGVFRYAADRGLRIVHHAGEGPRGGAASIREAITLGGAERIAHGIRALDDDLLVEELLDRNIGLDVCPSSNVALGFVSSMASHPLPHLLAAGLVASISTDIPSLVGISLADEYDRVRQSFGYGQEAVIQLARNAISASFASPELKCSLSKELTAWSSAVGVDAAGGAP